jgi:hypothetical protein
VSCLPQLGVAEGVPVVGCWLFTNNNNTYSPLLYASQKVWVEFLGATNSLFVTLAEPTQGGPLQLSHYTASQSSIHTIQPFSLPGSSSFPSLLTLGLPHRLDPINLPVGPRLGLSQSLVDDRVATQRSTQTLQINKPPTNLHHFDLRLSRDQIRSRQRT